jgi:hypothetical protein
VRQESGAGRCSSAFAGYRCRGAAWRNGAELPGFRDPDYGVLLPSNSIPAIVYAAQVNGKLQAGDLAGAQQASNNAKMWCFISLGLGLLVCLLYGVLIMAGILNGIRHAN